MKTLPVLALCLLILALGVFPASAQPVISAKSGTVSYHEGAVLIGDKALEDSLTKFEDVKENAILRTQEGRAEVLLTPGVILRVGENSSFKMITNRLIDTRLELLSGSATIEADEIAKDTSVTVVCKDATATILKTGFYRFDAEPARIKVFAGAAQVQMGGQTVQVPGGKTATLSGTVASIEKFDAADTDSLDRWSRRRNELLAMANVSAAKSLRDNGTTLSSGMWRWNPYFGMMTFIPASGRLCNPYWGSCFWSPVMVSRMYYVPPAPVYNGNNGFGGVMPSYSGMPATSSGYSGTMAASSSVSAAASAPAASSSGSTGASSAGSSSVGHGGASGGGRGH
jgi:hypothetical protein